jgi:hypothetical protein
MVLTPITARSLDDIPGLAHGFFTREGGTSGGVYASPDISRHPTLDC